MKIKFILVVFSFVSFAGYTQNVGVNTTTPQAVLDVNGDVIIRATELSVSDGITLSLDVNTARFSNYRITGPTADFTISGITAGIDGRLISLFNRSGFAMQLNNEDANAAVGDRIVTGTNADMIIPNKGVVNLQYDAAEQRWIVKSSNKGGGGSITGGYWDTDGTHIYNNNTGNVGIGTITPKDKLTVQTLNNNYGISHRGENGNILSTRMGGSTAGIGTFSATDMRIFSGGLSRIYINQGTGEVSIGTDAITTGNKLFVRTTGDSYGITHSSGNISVGTYVGGFPEKGWFGTISNHPLSFFANNGGALMTILQNGNVGIGNNSPTDKLHITGSTRLSGLQKIDGTNTLEFGFGVGGKEVNAGKIGYQAFTAGALDIIGAGTVSGNRKIKFWTEGGAEFAGTVGIGTVANSLYRFSVNGTVRSTEVVVETGWADYVFEKNYRLMPLDEVEKFILQNKHLPNIPSAKEIEEKGLQLGDTQKRMMEKIEELTLYVIELKKEIENLKLGK